MRVPRETAYILALAVGLLFQAPASAQSDTRGLMDRLDRLERDLNTLQSQVYRGQSVTSAIPAPPAAASVAPNVSGGAYGMLDTRLSALEEQIRALTGEVEKANFANSQLAAKLDRIQADDDFRLKELEAKAGIGIAAQAGAAAPPPGAPAGSPPPAGPTKLGPEPAAPSMGSPPGFLNHPAPGSQAAAMPPPPPAVAQSKSPQEQYDAAFGLLRNSDYDGASKAFQTFLSQHPQDPLAGNATYWLGQIPFAQGQYEKAAVVFLDAYQKYPKSAKAGESLLKVGLSMSNLGKKKEACAALHRFGTEFPDAADNLRRQATTEKQKLGC